MERIVIIPTMTALSLCLVPAVSCVAGIPMVSPVKLSWPT